MTSKQRHILFGAGCLKTAIANVTLLRQLWAFSLENSFSSHIVLIPFVSAALIFRKRIEIFSKQF